MSEIKFNPNENIGIGVEVEVQLINPITGNLKPSGLAILEELKQIPKSNHIKSEIFQSMLELDTPICTNAFEAGESLRQSLKLAKTVALKHGAQIIMSGTHPFAHYADRLLTPAGRYFNLVDRNQWITRRLQIFGLHVHLGMKDGDHAIAMNNALCHYLPLILALSASSPFWQSDDTGLASSRITFFEAVPTGGHPCLVANWNEFEILIAKLMHSKSITSLKDLWWDIRPNTEYGTIEIRIADCPPTVKEIEALVALIHTLALFINQELESGRRFLPPPEWILRENKWRVSRHGVSADLIQNLNGDSIPFIEMWQLLKESTHTVWTAQNYKSHFDFIDQVIELGPSYVRQRKFKDQGLDGVVRHLLRESLADYPEWY